MKVYYKEAGWDLFRPDKPKIETVSLEGEVIEDTPEYIVVQYKNQGMTLRQNIQREDIVAIIE